MWDDPVPTVEGNRLIHKGRNVNLSHIQSITIQSHTRSDIVKGGIIMAILGLIFAWAIIPIVAIVIGGIIVATAPKEGGVSLRVKTLKGRSVTANCRGPSPDLEALTKRIQAIIDGGGN